MDDCFSDDEDYMFSDQESLQELYDEGIEYAECKVSPDSLIQVVTQESLLAGQKEDLCRVMELLSVREHHARTLLIYHRWDAEMLFSVFAEKGKSYLFAEAGVPLVEHQNLGLWSLSSPVMCRICMEDVPNNEATRMDCGHCFCNNCWTEHFRGHINEGQSRRIRCMEFKCKAICDEAVVRALVSTRDPNLAKRFDVFLLETYIEDKRMVKWCPSVPHCGNAIRVEGDEFCEIECSCGLQFCFKCLAEAHSPCSCLMWELWTNKNKDESETANWITDNTTPCPKCHKFVEKNGGCNLVDCRCGQSFCWLCGGATGRIHDFDGIDGHSCEQYKEEQKNVAEQAQGGIHRYMHYYTRYKAHADSSKLETKLKETIQVKVSKLEQKEEMIRDFSWVTSAIHRLYRSRRILSYSYTFEYYMFGDKLFSGDMTSEKRELRQNLFMDHRQQLEANVEKLSKFTEEPFDQYNVEKVIEMRNKVIALSASIDTLCRILYDYVECDLLDSRPIAPYRSNGIQRALELPATMNTRANNTDKDPVFSVGI